MRCGIEHSGVVMVIRVMGIAHLGLVVAIRSVEDRALGCRDGHPSDGGSNIRVSWWSFVRCGNEHSGLVMVILVIGDQAFGCRDGHSCDRVSSNWGS